MQTSYLGSISMGSYMVNNVCVDLSLMIEIDQMLITIVIPLPCNYPKTEMALSRVRGEGLFTASLSVIADNRGWMDHLILARRAYGLAYGAGLALHGFYIIPRLYNIVTTNEEDSILSGLGKRAICAVIPYIAENLHINHDNTLILLEASGGQVTTLEDQRRVSNYVDIGRIGILNIYANQYSEAFRIDFDDLVTYSDQDLATSLVELENNEKLITYYIKTYGFLPLTHISMGTLMGTLLSTFVNYCNKN